MQKHYTAEPLAAYSKKGSKAKSNGAWEKADKVSHGQYSRYLRRIARKYPLLTAAERRIAALVIGLLSTRDIAKMLSVSEKTVENHRYNIRCKLRVKEPNLENFFFRK